MCSVAMVQSVPLLRLRARGECHQCGAPCPTHPQRRLRKWITASGKKRTDYPFPGRGVEGRKTVTRKNSTAAPFPPIGPAVAALAMGVWRLVVAIKHRRELAHLADFDDRMLADIGLTRTDLRDAYAEPLLQDPASMLARRGAERRASVAGGRPSNSRLKNNAESRETQCACARSPPWVATPLRGRRLLGQRNISAGRSAADHVEQRQYLSKADLRPAA